MSRRSRLGRRRDLEVCLPALPCGVGYEAGRLGQRHVAEEVFWIVKHGLKMSGMLAFGLSRNDGAICGIAAFVKDLPRTPERYAGPSEPAPCDIRTVP